ncbi:MAG: beta-lactamase family protein [Nonomuraea sp.]|nr:beta-lactamase family protein [Nonomuraea sp.]
MTDLAGRRAARVTVRRLLRHTSGLPEYFDLVDWTKPARPADHLALALTRPPTGEPGARWAYSNTNYLVAGMIIEKVTGRDFRAVTEDGVQKGLPGTYPKGSRYGLGVYTYPLSCGPAWMHDGGLPGVRVLSGRDRAGRAATVYVTGTPKDDRRLFAALDAALCR